MVTSVFIHSVQVATACLFCQTSLASLSLYCCCCCSCIKVSVDYSRFCVRCHWVGVWWETRQQWKRFREMPLRRWPRQTTVDWCVPRVTESGSVPATRMCSTCAAALLSVCVCSSLAGFVLQIIVIVCPMQCICIGQNIKSCKCPSVRPSVCLSVRRLWTRLWRYLRTDFHQIWNIASSTAYTWTLSCYRKVVPKWMALKLDQW